MGDRAIVAATVNHATYYLSAHPREWVPDRAEAADLDVEEARALVGQYGGAVVLVGQRREVRGHILVADTGRKF